MLCSTVGCPLHFHCEEILSLAAQAATHKTSEHTTSMKLRIAVPPFSFFEVVRAGPSGISMMDLAAGNHVRQGGLILRRSQRTVNQSNDVRRSPSACRERTGGPHQRGCQW